MLHLKFATLFLMAAVAGSRQHALCLCSTYNKIIGTELGGSRSRLPGLSEEWENEEKKRMKGKRPGGSMSVAPRVTATLVCDNVDEKIKKTDFLDAQRTTGHLP